MSIKSLFEFIVDPNITEKNMDEYLDEMSAQIDCNTDTTSDPEQQIEDEVFKNVYIPQRLDEVNIFHITIISSLNWLYQSIILKYKLLR